MVKKFPAGPFGFPGFWVIPRTSDFIEDYCYFFPSSSVLNSASIPCLLGLLLFLSWLITMDISSFENSTFIGVGCRSGGDSLSFLNWLAIAIACFFLFAVYCFLNLISSGVFRFILFIFHWFKHACRIVFSFLNFVYISFYSLFLLYNKAVDFSKYIISFLIIYFSSIFI